MAVFPAVPPSPRRLIASPSAKGGLPRCLAVPARDRGADNVLRAAQPAALDVARRRGRGRRDEGGKAKARACPALE